MKIDAQLTDEALLQLLGQRLTQLRLSRQLTQQQLAEQAGLGLRTVQRLEQGEAATQLSGFLRVCRVLGLLDRVELLLPEITPGPLAQLTQQTPQRQRVRKRKTPPRGTSKAAGWAWGDEP